MYLLEITEPSPPVYLLTIISLIIIFPVLAYVAILVFKKLNRNDKKRVSPNWYIVTDATEGQ